MGDSRYSFSLTTFSPSGKLMQIEYALNCVQKQGKTSLGIRARDGVVLATEKKTSSSLIKEESFEKVAKVCDSVGIVYAGMGGDFRVLLKKARKRAATYSKTYKDAIPVEQITRKTAAVMQEYTQQGGVRPFGVSLLIAGYDDDGPALFQADPSGAFFGWNATAIGSNSVNAKTFLEKRFSEDMELEDAIQTALLTLREGFEGEMTAHNVEVGVIGSDRKFRVLTPEDVQDYLDEAL